MLKKELEDLQAQSNGRFTIYVSPAPLHFRISRHLTDYLVHAQQPARWLDAGYRIRHQGDD